MSHSMIEGGSKPKPATTTTTTQTAPAPQPTNSLSDNLSSKPTSPQASPYYSPPPQPPLAVDYSQGPLPQNYFGVPAETTQAVNQLLGQVPEGSTNVELKEVTTPFVGPPAPGQTLPPPTKTIELTYTPPEAPAVNSSPNYATTNTKVVGLGGVVYDVAPSPTPTATQLSSLPVGVGGVTAQGFQTLVKDPTMQNVVIPGFEIAGTAAAAIAAPYIVLPAIGVGTVASVGVGSAQKSIETGKLSYGGPTTVRGFSDVAFQSAALGLVGGEFMGVVSSSGRTGAVLMGAKLGQHSLKVGSSVIPVSTAQQVGATAGRVGLNTAMGAGAGYVLSGGKPEGAIQGAEFGFAFGVVGETAGAVNAKYGLTGKAKNAFSDIAQPIKNKFTKPIDIAQSNQSIDDFLNSKAQQPKPTAEFQEASAKINRLNFDPDLTNAKIDKQISQVSGFDSKQANANMNRALADAYAEKAAMAKTNNVFKSATVNDLPSNVKSDYMIKQPQNTNLNLSGQINFSGRNTVNVADASAKINALGAKPSSGYSLYHAMMGEGRTLTAVRTKTGFDLQLDTLERMTHTPLPHSVFYPPASSRTAPVTTATTPKPVTMSTPVAAPSANTSLIPKVNTSNVNALSSNKLQNQMFGASPQTVANLNSRSLSSVNIGAALQRLNAQRSGVTTESSVFASTVEALETSLMSGKTKGGMTWTPTTLKESTQGVAPLPSTNKLRTTTTTGTTNIAPNKIKDPVTWTPVTIEPIVNTKTVPGITDTTKIRTTIKETTTEKTSGKSYTPVTGYTTKYNPLFTMPKGGLDLSTGGRGGSHAARNLYKRFEKTNPLMTGLEALNLSRTLKGKRRKKNEILF